MQSFTIYTFRRSLAILLSVLFFLFFFLAACFWSDVFENENFMVMTALLSWVICGFVSYYLGVWLATTTVTAHIDAQYLSLTDKKGIVFRQVPLSSITSQKVKHSELWPVSIMLTLNDGSKLKFYGRLNRFLSRADFNGFINAIVYRDAGNASTPHATPGRPAPTPVSDASVLVKHGRAVIYNNLLFIFILGCGLLIFFFILAFVVMHLRIESMRGMSLFGFMVTATWLLIFWLVKANIIDVLVDIYNDKVVFQYINKRDEVYLDYEVFFRDVREMIIGKRYRNFVPVILKLADGSRFQLREQTSKTYKGDADMYYISEPLAATYQKYLDKHRTPGTLQKWE